MLPPLTPCDVRFELGHAFSCWLLTLILVLCGAQWSNAEEPHATPNRVPRLVPMGSAMIAGLATVADDSGQLIPVAELSGLAHLNHDAYLAISDSDNRLIRFELIRDPQTQQLTGITLKQASTVTGPIRDYEGIALSKPFPGQPRWLYLSEEDTPAVRVFAADTLRELPVSPLPAPHIWKQNPPRKYYGLESLTLSPDQPYLWTATEQSLEEDGGRATVKWPTRIRLHRYQLDHEQATPAGEFTYNVDPIHNESVPGRFGTSGLCELVALPDGKLLALERSMIWKAQSLPGITLQGPALPSFENRICWLDPSVAEDVTHTFSVVKQKVAKVQREVLWKATDTADNFEGMCLGPASPQGYWLLLVSDNQRESTRGLLGTRLLLFELVMP